MSVHTTAEEEMRQLERDEAEKQARKLILVLDLDVAQLRLLDDGTLQTLLSLLDLQLEHAEQAGYERARERQQREQDAEKERLDLIAAGPHPGMPAFRRASSSRRS